MVSDMTAYTLHRTAYKAQGHASQVAGNFHNGRNKIKKSEDILKIQVKANHSNIHQPLYISFL